MSEYELKPCPFCGADGVVESSQIENSWLAYCGNPECELGPESGYLPSEQKAVEVWNTRAGGK